MMAELGLRDEPVSGHWRIDSPEDRRCEDAPMSDPVADRRWSLPPLPESIDRRWLTGLVVAMAVVSVGLGSTSLELSAPEARLGLAAAESWSSYGRVYDGWYPDLWPLRVGLSRLVAWGFEAGIPTAFSVRLPAALAASALGILLALRIGYAVSGRAGLFVGLAWFTSVAVIDRSGQGALEFVSGLGTVWVLERLVARRVDWSAGLGLAWAFLAGGWSSTLLVLLSVIVLGSPQPRHWLKLGTPILLAVASWMAWTWAIDGPHVVFGVLSLPLQQDSAWGLGLAVLAFAAPCGLFGLLALRSSLWCHDENVQCLPTHEYADGQVLAARDLARRWLRVVGVMVLGGSAIPGCGVAAGVPATAGLLIASGLVLDRAWDREAVRRWSDWTRRSFWVVATALALGWMIVATPGFLLVGVTIPYYLGVAISITVLAAVAGYLAVASWRIERMRPTVVALVVLAVSLKIAHGGFYVSEWNYRASAGAWGRAIGQWVPPRIDERTRWPIHTVTRWPHDLAFATGRPFRILEGGPRDFALEGGDWPRFVLLHASEFEHWPDDAPKLIEVMRFHDRRGPTLRMDRKGHAQFDAAIVLARTEGDLSWERRVRELEREEKD